MTQLQQELPKVKDAKYFSSMDVASGFWTIPVHVADQYKLAFTFAGRQYTFTKHLRNHILGAYLQETDHIFKQLTAAGAQISLSKNQWCRTKVSYVGLLEGSNVVEPQVNQVQGMTHLKTPTNISVSQLLRCVQLFPSIHWKLC